MLLGMDHAHLIPEHVAESTKFSSQLRLMSSMFGGQYILVGEGAPRLSWYDAMEADERSEASARTRKRREECRKVAQEARQTALKHTHKLPRKLWEDEGERKKTNPSVKAKPQGSEACGPGCKERRTLWREELTSLTTLVGTVATLLAVITPGEGAETEGGTDWHPKWNHEPGMEGLMNLDYWVVLPIIVMVVNRADHEDSKTSGRDVEARGRGSHPVESWRSKPSRRRGRGGYLQLVQDLQWEEHRSGSATPAVQRGSVPRRLFFAGPTENSRHLKA